VPKRSVQISEQRPTLLLAADRSFSSDDSAIPVSVPAPGPAYTVSALPAAWNVPGSRRSVVIEMSDQLFERQPGLSSSHSTLLA